MEYIPFETMYLVILFSSSRVLQTWYTKMWIFVYIKYEYILIFHVIAKNVSIFKYMGIIIYYLLLQLKNTLYNQAL